MLDRYPGPIAASHANPRAFVDTPRQLSDRLIERILFLEGLPNLQDLGKLLVGEDAAEMLRNDHTLLEQTRAGLQAAIHHCEGARDYVSRDLLAELLEESEEHIDWLETQFWLMDSTGLENYLQSQA